MVKLRTKLYGVQHKHMSMGRVTLKINTLDAMLPNGQLGRWLARCGALDAGVGRWSARCDALDAGVGRWPPN